MGVKNKINLCFYIGNRLNKTMSVAQIAKEVSNEYNVSINHAKMLVSTAKNKFEVTKVVNAYNKKEDKIKQLENNYSQLKIKFIIATTIAVISILLYIIK